LNDHYPKWFTKGPTGISRSGFEPAAPRKNLPIYPTKTANLESGSEKKATAGLRNRLGGFFA
jgi:hypothetical protein